jgi:hypothetical protein
MMSRKLNVGGDHLSQHEIKSQPLDATYVVSMLD